MEDITQNISALHHLLNYESRKFSSAEVQLKKILPEWINKAGSLKLKIVMQKYLDFVEHHLQKIDDTFEEDNFNSLFLTNTIMQAFIKEAEEKLSHCTDVEIKDACLLASIQAINHFKISTYGTAAAFAKTLGMEKQATVFHEAEINEKQIDDRLSQLAEFEINKNARAPIVLQQ